MVYRVRALLGWLLGYGVWVSGFRVLGFQGFRVSGF